MEMLASFFGWRQTPVEVEHHTSIVLSWENDTYNVNFKEFKAGFDEATVRDLKEKCKQLTDVPIAIMKLMLSGAYLKDDTATLTSAGVRKGSVVQIIGEKVNKRLVEQTASGNPEEYGCMVRIAKVVDPLVSNMQKEVLELEAAIEAPDAAEESVIRKHQDKIRYFSEMLVQAMITLDSVECPPEFTTAKQRRREGIKIAQQLLDRVDALRAKVKQQEAT